MTDPPPESGCRFFLKDVVRTFVTPAGDVAAVNGVSLRSDRAELLVVKGVSGSGKTTLINLLAGLDRPTSGHVYAFGQDIGRSSTRARAAFRKAKATVIFQEYNLLSMLTVVENVTLPLELQGIAARLATESAASALDRFGLGALADRFPGELSGGQRQRVAIARSFAATRPLVLADEPTGALDAESSRTVLDGLVALRAAGATVVVATHDPMFLSAADRTVELVDGRIADRAMV